GADAAATEGSLTGPITGSDHGIVMSDPATSQTLRSVSGIWESVTEELNEAGNVALLAPTDGPARVETDRPIPREARIETDLRFPAGRGTFTVDLSRSDRHRLGDRKSTRLNSSHV